MAGWVSSKLRHEPDARTRAAERETPEVAVYLERLDPPVRDQVVATLRKNTQFRIASCEGLISEGLISYPMTDPSALPRQIDTWPHLNSYTTPSRK
jgi:hypothetical protein